MPADNNFYILKSTPSQCYIPVQIDSDIIANGVEWYSQWIDKIDAEKFNTSNI